MAGDNHWLQGNACGRCLLLVRLVMALELYGKNSFSVQLLVDGIPIDTDRHAELGEGVVIGKPERGFRSRTFAAVSIRCGNCDRVTMMIMRRLHCSGEHPDALCAFGDDKETDPEA